jgi:hypothetical protein
LRPAIRSDILATLNGRRVLIGDAGFVVLSATAVSVHFTNQVGIINANGNLAAANIERNSHARYSIINSGRRLQGSSAVFFLIIRFAHCAIPPAAHVGSIAAGFKLH